MRKCNLPLEKTVKHLASGERTTREHPLGYCRTRSLHNNQDTRLHAGIIMLCIVTFKHSSVWLALSHVRLTLKHVRRGYNCFSIHFVFIWALQYSHETLLIIW